MTDLATFGVISQSEALAATPLVQGEAARFFVAPRLGDVDCLRATYVTHTYVPHTHDTFVVGMIESGCETWRVRGETYYGVPGDLVFINPLEVHDGAPHGGGYSYRTSYPAEDLLRDIAEGVSGRRRTGALHFRAPCVRDPQGAVAFAAAHAATEAGADGLAAEERLNRAYAGILVRHAGVVPAALGDEAGPVARVRALIEAHHAEDLTLERLACEARLSVHHLIRAFRRQVGMTPHAYLVDVRVRRAKTLLRRGEAPVAVAASVGFADQAHLSRAFKVRVGVGPAAYARAASA